MFQKIRKWKWFISATLCFVLLYILPATFIEKYYSQGFFLLIRNIFDNTLAYLPFPSYYVLIVVLIIFIIKWFLNFFHEKPKPFSNQIFKVFSFSAFLITLFFILWGFNYGRILVENKLSLNIKPLSNTQLIDEVKTTIANLYDCRNAINKNAVAIPEIVFVNKIEDNSRNALNISLNKFNYPFSKKIRGRFLLEDMLLVFNVGGQYMPYVGEANVDEGVHYYKKPFYLIHEMAHGNGFTEEAVCNFFAYVSCTQSTNKSLQYSGELNYLKYLLPELNYRDEEAFTAINDAMPWPIKSDLILIRKHYEQHMYRSSFLGDIFNNYYLKILGVNDGIKNYEKMILLVYAWKHNVDNK